MSFANAAGNLGTAIGLAGEVNSLITTGDFSFRDATNADILNRLDALSTQIDQGFQDLTETIYRSDLDAAVNEAQTVFTQLSRVNAGTLTLDSNGELLLSNQAIDAYVGVYDKVTELIALSDAAGGEGLPADLMATVYTAATFVMTLQQQFSATLNDGAIGEAVLSDQLIDMANAVAGSEFTLRRTLTVNIEVTFTDGGYRIGERSSRYDGASIEVINAAIDTVLAADVFTVTTENILGFDLTSFKAEFITDWGDLFPTNPAYSNTIAELLAEQPEILFPGFPNVEHRNWMAKVLSVLVTEEVMRATGALDRAQELELKAIEWAFLSNGVQIVDPVDAGGNEIIGSSYFDFLIGNGGDDSIYGGDRADVIYGGGNNPLKYGDDSYANDGDDYVYAGSGTDLVRGGSGDDHLVGGGDNDTLYGGDGNDQLWGSSGLGTFAGMLGVDSLVGGAGNDVIWLDDPFQSLGQTGHGDTADGGPDNDTIHGSINNDSIKGGVDDDTLYGERGMDTLVGGDGADYLIGGPGNDTLLGGDGNDTLFGDGNLTYDDDQIANYNADADGYEHDRLEGDDGDDVLVGQEGEDTLFGGPGADSLWGGNGDDTLWGGEDDDLLIGQAADDRLIGEGGNDILYGEDGNDALFGNDGDDSLYGQQGDDELAGGAGNDLLVGGIGNDTLVVNGSGENSLYGGAGEDLLAGSLENDLMSGGADNDTLIGSAGEDTLLGDGGDDLLEGGSDADTLEGGDGSDTLLGEDGNDSAYGGNGADTITGGEGDDFLFGDFNDFEITTGAGDSIDGEAGDDYLDGGTGGDTLIGGIGHDSLLGWDGADSLLGGDGFDLLLGFDDSDALDGGEGNDSMRGGLGDDTLQGGDGDDTLKGDDNSSSDDLGGNDLVEGGVGNDVLEGGFGDDTLNGDGDNDTLEGGHGTDVLNGGAGNDRFVISGSDAAMFDGDIDGGAGTDAIDLRGLKLAYSFADQVTAADGSESGTILITGTDAIIYSQTYIGIEGFFEAGDTDPAGDLPIAAFDSITIDINADGTVSGDVLANDTDPYAPIGDMLTVSGVRTGVEHDGGDFSAISTSLTIEGTYGSLLLNDNGTYTYSIDASDPDTVGIDYSASEQFTYQVTDGDGLTDLTRLSISVYRGEDDSSDSFGGATDVPQPLVVEEDDTQTVPLALVVDEAPPTDVSEQPISKVEPAIVNSPPVGEIAITGSANVDETLTVVPMLTDLDGLGNYAFQWLRGLHDIPGATSSTYMLTSEDLGEVISVRVSYTDDLGTDETVTSAATEAVGDVLDQSIVGLNGGETLTGGAGNDTITGNGGDDTVSGGAGDDTVSGGPGNDSVNGDDGNDEISGASGNDVVNGGTGDDNMGGGLDNDTMDGGNGNDTMGGGQGDDVMHGGDGNDIVNGGGGNDSISGNKGNDTMGASFGNDTVIGGPGDDSLGGGTGRDSLVAGAGDDALGGGEGDDTVKGGAGDDFVAGGGRNDDVSGGAGNDRINGGDGDDTMTGGEGADVFIYNFFKDGDADVITDFEDGIDSFRMIGVENAPGTGLQGKLDALNITDAVGGALIDYQGHTVLVEGVSVASLGLDDFAFL